MELLENLQICYKNKNIPEISLGDTIKVVIFLELPKDSEGEEKKEKERIQSFEGVVISKYPYQPESRIDIAIKNKWNDLIPIIK